MNDKNIKFPITEQSVRCTLFATFGHFEQRTLCRARAVCEAKLSSSLLLFKNALKSPFNNSRYIMLSPMHNSLSYCEIVYYSFSTVFLYEKYVFSNSPSFLLSFIILSFPIFVNYFFPIFLFFCNRQAVKFHFSVIFINIKMIRKAKKRETMLVSLFLLFLFFLQICRRIRI